MFLFGRRRKKAAVKTSVDLRQYEIAAESMMLLQSTLNPKTFFGRCDDIANAEMRVTGQPSAFLQDIELLTHLQIDFIDRVVEAGRKEALRGAMPQYTDRLTEAAAKHYALVMKP